MAIRIYTNSYGSPGDVENKNFSTPGTLTAWIEAAKKANESEGGFVTCITEPPPGSTTISKCLVHVEQVEWVYEVP